MTRPAWMDRTDLDPLATAFAEFAWRAHEGRMGDTAREALAKITFLLSVERARGHGAIHPERWAGVADHPQLPDVVLPDVDTWIAALERAVWVGDGTHVTPLVRRADGSLALHRDDVAERRLARSLRSMASDVATSPPPPSVIDAFRGLFPAAPAEGPALAAATALRARLAVITGGPGTGKTTTVVRVLAVLLAADPTLRIAIAAPTGKAASRLRSSIARQRDGLPVDDAVKAAIPMRVDTVHGLLGYRPHDGRFRHGARDPLPADVVVVDEASMLDLTLASVLVDALGPRTRLILLGDPDQLASVDAGAVLEDIVDARATTGDARSAGFAAFAKDLFSREVDVDPATDALADATAELRFNHRSGDQPGIARLSDALRDGDAEDAVEALISGAPGLQLVERPRHGAALAPTVDAWLSRGETAHGDADADRLDLVESRLRLLTALRHGPWGVAGLNDLVESRLRARGWDTRERWYHGRPIMILRNERAMELANGDVGVCVRDPESGPVVVVRGPDDALRRFPALTLPPHETAWAMTVHKSQGSEFQHVLMVLPPEGHPLATRSLLYTGVTRARLSVTVVGTKDAIRAAVEAKEKRRTALQARLQES